MIHSYHLPRRLADYHGDRGNPEGTDMPDLNPFEAELATLNAAQRAIANMTRKDVERILARTKPEPETGCLPWQGTVDLKGYPKVRIGGLPSYAHRALADWWNGPIEEGWVVHHWCENKRCLARDHLVITTVRDHNRIHLLERMAARA